MPQGVGPEAEAEASECAVQLVATEEGVATTEVEYDHRALEARSERPVHAGVAVAVGTAPRQLGPGCAQQRTEVVPIHPALPFGEERQRRASRRWRKGKATPAVAATAVGKQPRGAKRNRDRKDYKLIALATERSRSEAEATRPRSPWRGAS